MLSSPSSGVYTAPLPPPASLLLLTAEFPSARTSPAGGAEADEGEDEEATGMPSERVAVTEFARRFRAKRRRTSWSRDKTTGSAAIRSSVGLTMTTSEKGDFEEEDVKIT